MDRQRPRSSSRPSETGASARARGQAHLRAGQPAAAIAAFKQARGERPDDPDLCIELAQALREVGDVPAALAQLQECVRRAPDSRDGWYALGNALAAATRTDEARAAYERALACDPGFVHARSALGDTLKHLGDLDGAIACYRACLRDRAFAPRAWFQIANTKTVPMSAQDASALRALLADAGLRDADRVFCGFALGKALEDQGLYRAAFAAIDEANRLAHRHAPWNARQFSAQIDAVAAAFDQPLASTDDARLGREVVFVVSMPRAGSTLAVQILSAHSQVEAAGELPDLEAVLMAESKRRGIAFPGWVRQAAPADWRRLGEDYLARTARWRHAKPISIDKGLLNWALLGAAAAMLPGARFIDCRRDALETCLSCYRQLFAFGNHFSYDIDALAAYWHDYDRLCRVWRRVLGERLFVHAYEDLQADPQAQIRRMLAFLDLAFEPACLQFHRSGRIVRTFSAAQVRQPLQRDTARAHRYGAALEPLRSALRRAGWT